VATAIPAPRRTSREAVETAIAGLGLLAIAILALLPGVTATPADKLTLLFLAVVAFVCFWTPLIRVFEEQPGAANFALTAGMFVVYSLARNAGPKDGWALRFAMLPDDTFPVSYAAEIAVLCAFVTLPTWWRSMNGWIRSLLVAGVVLALLATLSFVFLGGKYVVGATEELDPTPLPTFGMQLIEYTAVALLCTAVTANPVTRRVALRILPFALLALWARHEFMAAPPKKEAE
jgi:hypothetical protein